METSDKSYEALQREALMFRRLKQFMGYVQNGSDTTVTMHQDDATQTYVLRVGNSTFYGMTLEACINQAVAADMHVNYEGEI
ncbi:hypothetical protein [Methylotenera sp.]|uniref:hypothetical protein n=1 Tax=Methylotenera sp. TaxID=2051956 RepID=UPI0024897E94|nr:hypothetical protein [Methylotenera sp.]MDI1362557.1 hypothetical protein [Methylotenera sp.]